MTANYSSTDSLSANDACSPLFALDDLPTQRRLVSDLSQPQSVRFEARRGRVSAALANRGGVPRKRQQSSGYRRLMHKLLSAHLITSTSFVNCRMR
jgi:hypothetical protein